MNLKNKIQEYIEWERSNTNCRKPKHLDIIQVGDNPASELYVKSKLKEAEKWNIECEVHKFPEDATGYEVQRCVIKSINHDCNGMIIQLPLPEHLHEQVLINHIDPWKNVDGFKQNHYEEFKYFYPCTPLGIVGFLESYVDLESKTVVVIGRGKTVGNPLVKMLLRRNCTIVECNSFTPETTLKTFLKQADVVISAVGKPNLFNVDDLKEKCIVIDAGISRIDGKQVGDFSHEGDLSKVDYTPWTNGVGKLTVAALMMNVRKEVI